MRTAVATLLLVATAACGEAVIATPAQLTLVQVAPHHGATQVSTSTTVELGFNDALDIASVSSASVRIELDGAVVEARQLLSSDRHQLTLIPTSVLQPETAYVVVVDAKVAGFRSGELGTTLRSRFRTGP